MGRVAPGAHREVHTPGHHGVPEASNLLAAENPAFLGVWRLFEQRRMYRRPRAVLDVQRFYWDFTLETMAHPEEYERLFVLTTQATHWFNERGFTDASIDALPLARQAPYNYERGSKVLIKKLH